MIRALLSGLAWLAFGSLAVAQTSATLGPGTAAAVPLPWTPTPTLRSTSGSAEAALNATTTVDPPTSSTAIVAGGVLETDYAAAAAPITGGGHILGAVGYINNLNPTNQIPLAAPLEAKVSNEVSGASIDSLFSVYSQLAQNVAGANINSWFGSFANVALNSGTIGLATASTLQLNTNSGTINALVGMYVPPLAGPNTGTINVLTGLYFGAQTLTFGVKHAVDNEDSGADIYSAGPITTPLTLSGGVVKTAVVPLAAFGAASACPGCRGMASDLTSTTFDAPAVGGGTNTMPIWSDGTTWKIGG